MRHGACESLPRHCHRDAFAAVVLAGGYDEAGDTGRHRVRAGDVVFHGPFESHLDRFHRRGAEVLVIPLPAAWDGPPVGVAADPDAIARASERDQIEALRLLATSVAPRGMDACDWPDLLAKAIREDPALCLASWAESIGLHPASLSRGFASVFGTTPARYRRIQRTRRAIRALASNDGQLATLALDCGFADQAHMSREVTALAGVAPRLVRGLCHETQNADLCRRR